MNTYPALIGLLTGLLIFGCGGAQHSVELDSGGNTAQTEGEQSTEKTSPKPEKRAATLAFSLGVKAFKEEKNYRKAAELFEEAAEEDPTLGSAYFNAGVCYERLGDLNAAERWYRRASAKAEGFGDGLANIGYLRLKDGRESEADSLFREAMALDKFNAIANLNLANDARARGDFKTAVKHVRTALTGESRNAQAYEVLARIYYTLKRYELAKLVCLTGLKIDGSYAPLHNVLGLVNLKLDDVRAAIAAFEAAIQAEGSYAPAHTNLGAITFNYRDYESSLRHFEAVLQTEPKNRMALVSKAASLRGLGRLNEAEAGYQKALAIDPTFVPAHYNLGILYQEYLNNFDAALVSFEKVLQNEQQDAVLRTNVSKRIEAVRIQVQNMKEVEEMMRQQRAQEEAQKSQGNSETNSE